MHSTPKHPLIALARSPRWRLRPPWPRPRPKIGFVNTARLLEESPQARAAQTALEGEFLPRQRELASAAEDARRQGREAQARCGRHVRGRPQPRPSASCATASATWRGASTSCRRTPTCAATRSSARSALAAAGSADLRARQRLRPGGERRRAVRLAGRGHHGAGGDGAQGQGSPAAPARRPTVTDLATGGARHGLLPGRAGGPLRPRARG
jgi:hypothetical protein